MFIEETHEHALKPSEWPNRAAALLLITYCAPLIAMLALAIKLESKGPVLVQSRIDGRNIFRFRTTIQEESQQFNRNSRDFISEDTTALGAFLQISRLEFLPRLWNVAAGEYSIAALLR